MTRFSIKIRSLMVKCIFSHNHSALDKGRFSLLIQLAKHLCKARFYAFLSTILFLLQFPFTWLTFKLFFYSEMRVVLPENFRDRILKCRIFAGLPLKFSEIGKWFFGFCLLFYILLDLLVFLVFV